MIRRVRTRAMRAARILLSGLYSDLESCHYVVLQDDVQQLRGNDCFAHVRVMRERHAYVRAGTIRIPASLYSDLGTAASDANEAISQALILWLQRWPLTLRFALRAVAVRDERGVLGIRLEEDGVQSS